jgi:hypothetical protein
MVQAGNENGFVSNETFVFLCKKNTIEAYDEIHGGCYRTYFAEQLLPNLSLQSVVVVNSASYSQTS